MTTQKNPVPPAPQPRVWTPLDLIRWTQEFFSKKGIEQPRLEAELLLAEVLGCPRIQLYVNFEKSVAPEKLAIFRELVKRRGEKREPIQYIIGHAQFIDLKLKVTPAVLIPRPETEILAVWAVDTAKTIAAEKLRVLDLCTGSGCMALYVASKEPRADVTATDISAQALEVAAENARTLTLEARVHFVAGDLFGALPAGDAGSFDLLVTNPPYIAESLRSTLQPEVRDHEPAGALFAPDEGLGIAKRILSEAPGWLKPGGWLGMEFGINQAEPLKNFAESAGGFESVEIRQDGAKLPRFLLARRKP